MKTHERDGYAAVQLGFGDQHGEALHAGRCSATSRSANLPPCAPRCRSSASSDASAYAGRPDARRVDLFEIGKRVDVVSGVDQGPRLPRASSSATASPAASVARLTTHGKQPGSIGASAYPSRVIKGKRLPGRMGGEHAHHQEPRRSSRSTRSRTCSWSRGAIPGPIRTASSSFDAEEAGRLRSWQRQGYTARRRENGHGRACRRRCSTQQVHEHLLYLAVKTLPGQPAAGHGQGEEPRRGLGRRQEAVEAEGHRSCALRARTPRRCGRAAVAPSGPSRATTASSCRRSSAARRSPRRCRSGRARTRVAVLEDLGLAEPKTQGRGGGAREAGRRRRQGRCSSSGAHDENVCEVVPQPGAPAPRRSRTRCTPTTLLDCEAVVFTQSGLERMKEVFGR